MIGTRRGQIPSDLGWLIDELDDMHTKIDDLESLDGAQRFGTGNFLRGLKTYGASNDLLATGTVPNDGVTRFFYPTPDMIVQDIDVPTSKLLISASVGEASITPGGSFVVAYAGFTVRDIDNGVVTPARSANVYTNTRQGLPMSTGQQYVDIDPVANPGPYTIRFYTGMWVATLNTTACSTQFSDMSLVVQIVGEGV